MEKSMVRRPAVAGRFYPARAEILTREIEEYLGPGGEAAPTVEGALGCIAPHAGYMYSGHVAGAVYRRLPPRASYIALGPNHFGRGAPLATNSSGTWLTPLGEIPVDHDLATALLAATGSGYMIALYILFCAVVSIVATALMPDYTNKDISEEHDRP